MIATALWLALVAGALALEIAAHRTGAVAPLSRVAARLGATRTGRVVFWAVWAFVGFHLFARDSFAR